MKVYRLEIMIIDFDQLGPEEIKDVLESQKYPNYCIDPDVMKIEEAEIGEWTDDNPLNSKETRLSEYQRIFRSKEYREE